MGSDIFGHLKIKQGALRAQLLIPKGKKIPITLLIKIERAKIGTTVSNPTKIGKQRIVVTKLLKRRVVLANNMRKWRKS